MPCNMMDGADFNHSDIRALEQRVSVLERDTNNLTRFACEAIRTGMPVPEYLRNWWERHQEHDREHGR